MKMSLMGKIVLAFRTRTCIIKTVVENNTSSHKVMCINDAVRIFHMTAISETAAGYIGKRGARTGGLRVSGCFNPEPDLDNANVGR